MLKVLKRKKVMRRLVCLASSQSEILWQWMATGFLKLKKVKVDDLSKYLRQRLYGGNRYTVATAIQWQRLYGDNHYTAGRKAK